MTLQTRFDFLVLGGGPAGCVFAIRAAQAGARVAVIERRGYDLRRPGEYLDPSIRDVFRELGLSGEDAARVAEPSPGIISLWDSPTPITQSFRATGRPAPIAVVRHYFDRLLSDTAAEAGVRNIRSSAVPKVHTGNGVWEVTTTIDDTPTTLAADCIVDASGRTAVYARTQGSKRDRDGSLYATVLWFQARSSQGKAAGPLIIEAAGDGWWSLAETPGGEIAATYYTHRRALPSRHVHRIQHAVGSLASAPYIAARLEYADAEPIGARSFAAFPSRLDRPAGENWIAIGDAAATYDPLCGKGTIFAIQSAFRAAEALIWGSPADRETYCQAVRARCDAHRQSRREVYAMAGSRLSREFVDGLGGP